MMDVDLFVYLSFSTFCLNKLKLNGGRTVGGLLGLQHWLVGLQWLSSPVNRHVVCVVKCSFGDGGWRWETGNRGDC